MLAFGVVWLVASPARASDMASVGLAMVAPVNVVAAMAVAPLGIRSAGRPGTLGNIFVALVAVFLGAPNVVLAFKSLSLVSESADIFVCGYLVSFALLATALGFAIYSRVSQL